MTLSGRPLLGTRRDLALFVGREAEAGQLLRGLKQGLNCVISGEPGMGRTSLARTVAARSGLDEVFVGGSGPEMGTAAGLLLGVLRELGEPESAVSRSPLELVGAVRAAIERRPAGSEPVLIVVDDVAGNAGFDLFGSLRDELWTVDARWLVTVSAAQAPALVRPPADVFFEIAVELGPLTDSEAAELLRRRLDQPAAALIDSAVAAAGGNPRRLLDFARAMPDGAEAAGLAVQEVQSRDRALSERSRSAQLLARELESLGGASASDAALLDRMGWTRARAVQVLGELEDSGLVTHRMENLGRGRPRKVYRLLSPGEFNAADTDTGEPKDQR